MDLEDYLTVQKFIMQKPERSFTTVLIACTFKTAGYSDRNCSCSGAFSINVNTFLTGTDISSTMTLDLLKDNIMKEMSEKKQIITMQILIVFFIVVSVVIRTGSADLYCSAYGNFMG